MRRGEQLRPGSLLARLLGPAEAEASCEECFDHLDRYVELELARADAVTIIPRLRSHLDGCPACQEDYESLRAFLSDGIARRD